MKYRGEYSGTNTWQRARFSDSSSVHRVPSAIPWSRNPALAPTGNDVISRMCAHRPSYSFFTHALGPAISESFRGVCA